MFNRLETLQHALTGLPLPVRLAFKDDTHVFAGGFPGQKSVQEKTSDHFMSTFTGCIKEFAWTEDAVITDFSRYKGENIGSCDFL